MYNWNFDTPTNINELSDEELNQLQAEVQRALSRISIYHTFLVEERIVRAEKKRGKRT